MRKILSLLMAVCAVACLSVSCCRHNEDKKQSLSLSPASLEFEASVNVPQQVTVIAENVEWYFEFASNASDWLEVKKEGKGLAVTVKDNTRADRRFGIIKVIPDASDVSIKEITVSQKGSSEPVTLEILLSPTSISFKGDNAEPQEVSVTMRGDGFTWTASAADADKEWLKVETQEGKIIVTAEDNPLAKERSGMVNVVPSEKGISPKTLLVTQEAKFVAPALSVDKPDGLTFGERDKEKQVVNINAVNCKWAAAVRDENNVGVSWVTIAKTNTSTESKVTVEVEGNVSEERVAYLVITAVGKEDGKPIESVPVVKVKITQAKGRDAVSTLKEDVKFTAAGYNGSLLASQRWDTNPKLTPWSLNFYDAGITFENNEGSWPPKDNAYVGTGHRIFLDMVTTPIHINDDQEYFIPTDKDYTVNYKPSYDSPELPYTINSGREKYYIPPVQASITLNPKSSLYPFGSWYFTIKDGKDVAAAPIVDGTIHIERTGYKYVITMNLLDDAGNKIEVTYSGKLEDVRQGNADLKPPGTPDPGDPEEPEIPPFTPPGTYRR